MSPQTGSRRYTHTHLKWFMGTLVFSTLHCKDFSFFYFLFSFLRVHKKPKNTNKRIRYFFPLRCFLRAFFIFVCLFTFLYFCLVAFLYFLCFWCFLVLFGTFWCFWCFLCVQNLSIKKKKFKTALITSFILLLNLSYCRHEFFNYHNFFQL